MSFSMTVMVRPTGEPWVRFNTKKKELLNRLVAEEYIDGSSSTEDDQPPLRAYEVVCGSGLS